MQVPLSKRPPPARTCAAENKFIWPQVQISNCIPERSQLCRDVGSMGTFWKEVNRGGRTGIPTRHSSWPRRPWSVHMASVFTRTRACNRCGTSPASAPLRPDVDACPCAAACAGDCGGRITATSAITQPSVEIVVRSSSAISSDVPVPCVAAVQRLLPNKYLHKQQKTCLHYLIPLSAMLTF